MTVFLFSFTEKKIHLKKKDISQRLVPVKKCLEP